MIFAPAVYAVSQRTITHSACCILVLKHLWRASPAHLSQCTDCHGGRRSTAWRSWHASPAPLWPAFLARAVSPSWFQSKLDTLLAPIPPSSHCSIPGALTKTSYPLAPAVLGMLAASWHHESLGGVMVLFNSVSLPIHTEILGIRLCTPNHLMWVLFSQLYTDRAVFLEPQRTVTHQTLTPKIRKGFFHILWIIRNTNDDVSEGI